MVICAALGLLLLVAPGAFAADGGATVTREIIVNETVVTPDEPNPCFGGTDTLIRTFNGFLQLTTRPGGTTHMNGRLEATDVRFIPDDPARGIYTGRELVTGSFNTNSNTSATTFIVRVWLVGPDGASAHGHILERLTVSPGGTTVEFEKPVISCD
jgi:hypothetical protein